MLHSIMIIGVGGIGRKMDPAITKHSAFLHWPACMGKVVGGQVMNLERRVEFHCAQVAPCTGYTIFWHATNVVWSTSTCTCSRVQIQLWFCLLATRCWCKTDCEMGQCSCKCIPWISKDACAYSGGPTVMQLIICMGKTKKQRIKNAWYASKRFWVYKTMGKIIVQYKESAKTKKWIWCDIDA